MKFLFLAVIMSSICASIANANASIKMPMKYSAYKANEECYKEEVLWGSPLVVGVQRLQRNWTLRINVPSYFAKENVQSISVKSLSRNSKTLENAKALGIQERSEDSSTDYLFEVPIPKKSRSKNFKQEEMFQTSLLVKAQLKDRVDEQSIVVYLVPLKSEMRIYDMTNVCYIANPPEITDGFEIHRSSHGAQDVQIEHEFIQEEDTLKEKSLGILELSYYASYSSGANSGRLGDQRFRQGYSVSYFKKEDYREQKSNSLKVSYTFQVNPGYVGYVVPMREDQYIPYKDVQFNKCGQVKLTGGFDQIEKRIRNSYQMVSVRRKYEGNLDYVYSKIKKEFKYYNTCRE